MTLDEASTELEEDLLWRLEELATIRNHTFNEPREEKRVVFLKALVLMLYSHFEGYCKNALLVYLRALNSLSLKRSDVLLALVTSSMVPILQEVAKRTSFADQLEFIRSLESVWDEVVVLPDQLVDTESNLKPVVLKKILTRMGFPEDLFSTQEGQVHRLLNRRNNVAHGVRITGLSGTEYQELEAVVFDMMSLLKTTIFASLVEKRYLKGA